jgi:hypothetical protein
MVRSARAASGDPAGGLGASTMRDSREEEDWAREGPHGSGSARKEATRARGG